MQENQIKEKSKKQKIFADLILVLVIIALALSVLLFVKLTSHEGAYVEVSVNNGAPTVYSLSVDGEYVINGGTNIIVISGGKVYMKSADCPDKTCVHQGAISMTGERIVCLPNKVHVVVVDEGEEEILR